MAGTQPGFDATQFRDAIRFTMNMGLPNNVSERATFRWRTKRAYAKPDTLNRPYNWNDSAISEESHEDVQVPCAVEFAGSANVEGTAVGDFEKTQAVITVLDTEFELIKGASQVLLGGDTYEILYVAPPVGLFEVTVYQIYCQALDET